MDKQTYILALNTYKICEPMTWTDWTTNSITDRKRVLDGITPEDNVHKDNAHKVAQAHKKNAGSARKLSA